MSARKSLKPIDQLKHPHLKGEFACAVCPSVFLHKASLDKHRRKCLKQHTCLLCGIEIGNLDALRQHMKINHGMSNIYTCQCCAFTFENKRMLIEHCEQFKSTGTVDETRMIGTAGQVPGSLHPKKIQNNSKETRIGSLSPSLSSSNDSSTCPTAGPTPRAMTPVEELKTPEVSGEVSEEPMDEFQKMTSEIIGNMIDNGWYSDEQLVLPETWEKMVGEAQKMAQKAFEKTAKRGTKRARVE